MISWTHSELLVSYAIRQLFFVFQAETRISAPFAVDTIDTKLHWQNQIFSNESLLISLDRSADGATSKKRDPILHNDSPMNLTMHGWSYSKGSKFEVGS